MQSEYEILKKIVSSLKVFVQVTDPDNPSQGLYDEVRRIASVYVCLVVREINVSTLMEPSEQHILNPVLLYRLVEDCILRYSQIVRGTVPDAITNLWITSSLIVSSSMMTKDDFLEDTMRKRLASR